jgi:hypothetical protein
MKINSKISRNYKFWYTSRYPATNSPIENCFNQIKHYLKLNKKVLKYDELNNEIKDAINNVKKENWKS